MDIVPGDRSVDCRDKGEALNLESTVISLPIKIFLLLCYCVTDSSERYDGNPRN